MKQKIIAIDGKTESGKSALAEELAKDLGAFVVHLDDYRKRLTCLEPDWHLALVTDLDLNRLMRQILEPALSGRPLILQKLDPETQNYTRPDLFFPPEFIIVEGTGCLHPDLEKYYAFKVFMDEGIEETDPSREKYFEVTEPQKRSDMII